MIISTPFKVIIIKLLLKVYFLYSENQTWLKHKISSEVLTPCGRRGHSAVLFQNALHIYGGYIDLKGSTNEIWTFDLGSLNIFDLILYYGVNDVQIVMNYMQKIMFIFFYLIIPIFSKRFLWKIL